MKIEWHIYQVSKSWSTFLSLKILFVKLWKNAFNIPYSHYYKTLLIIRRSWIEVAPESKFQGLKIKNEVKTWIKVTPKRLKLPNHKRKIVRRFKICNLSPFYYMLIIEKLVFSHHLTHRALGTDNILIASYNS